MDVHKEEEEEEEDEKYEFTEQRRRERERDSHDYDREAEKRRGARLSRNGAAGGEARMHETSVRVKAAKCALDAAHLSLPTAHRPLPARSTNWANRWTPTDLFDPALVVAHATRAHPFFRPPPPALLPADRHRLIPESDVDVGCRLRSGIADSDD